MMLLKKLLNDETKKVKKLSSDGTKMVAKYMHFIYQVLKCLKVKNKLH